MIHSVTGPVFRSIFILLYVCEFYEPCLIGSSSASSTILVMVVAAVLVVVGAGCCDDVSFSKSISQEVVHIWFIRFMKDRCVNLFLNSVFDEMLVMAIFHNYLIICYV